MVIVPYCGVFAGAMFIAVAALTIPAAIITPSVNIATTDVNELSVMFKPVVDIMNV